jgi:hypothetical protein
MTDWTAVRADLTGLLARAGIVDVDVSGAVADEHVRSAAYQRVVAVVAAARSREDDRAVVAAILRDPEELTAKTAVVALVDGVAERTGDPAAFRRWAAGLAPELERLSGGHRGFVWGRVHDWAVYLTVRSGQAPAAGELVGVTHWMQRRLASEATLPGVLAVLAEDGRTRKVRDAAGERLRSVTSDSRQRRGGGGGQARGHGC